MTPDLIRLTLTFFFFLNYKIYSIETFTAVKVFVKIKIVYLNVYVN